MLEEFIRDDLARRPHLTHFCPNLPALFAMTVIGADGKGGMVTRGLFIGDTADCFEQASKLSLEVNFTLLEKPQRKVVCYLDPEEYHFLWTANKAIYRYIAVLATPSLTRG